MKILVIRFSSIGDIVLTTPVVRCLSKQLDVQIHFLTKNAYRPLLRANPYIIKVHAIDNQQVIKELKSEQFDQIIDLQKSRRSYRVRQKLGVSAYSFPKLNTQKWLWVNTGINFMPDLHIVDRYFEAVRHLQVSNDGLGLEISGLSSVPVPVEMPYVAMVIGGTHQTKKMPHEQLTQLCGAIAHPVVTLGGQAEREIGAKLESEHAHVVNACNRYDLLQSASLVNQARLVVSHDTGFMHIAAALDKDIVSIWGNTAPGFGMYPYRTQGSHAADYTYQVPGLRCRPCSKLGHERCPRGHFKCMKEQNITEIATVVNRCMSTTAPT